MMEKNGEKDVVVMDKNVKEACLGEIYMKEINFLDLTYELEIFYTCFYKNETVEEGSYESSFVLQSEKLYEIDSLKYLKFLGIPVETREEIKKEIEEMLKEKESVSYYFENYFLFSEMFNLDNVVLMEKNNQKNIYSINIPYFKLIIIEDKVSKKIYLDELYLDKKII